MTGHSVSSRASASSSVAFRSAKVRSQFLLACGLLIVVGSQSTGLAQQPAENFTLTPQTRRADALPLADTSLPELIAHHQPLIAKVYGAAAGLVEGYSSGIVVSPDGLIVSSQGVYLDGQRVRVGLADGSVHDATILRRDRQLQLALLKINVATPRHFDLTNPASVQQGDWVVALSNAFRVADGKEPVSAWLGSVSLQTSIHARLNERDVAYSGSMVLVDSITSNPGAAGGALLALDGRLVGVLGKIIDSTETNTRLNYAVPTDVVRDFVEGKVSEPAIAVQITAEPGETGIRLFELGGKSAPAYIERVRAGSPAAAAGLQADDLVISVGGEKTGSVRDCNSALALLPAGVEAVLVVKRGNELLRVALVPAARDGNTP